MLWTTGPARIAGMAHGNLGPALYREGKFEGAAAHFAEAARLNPRDGNAYNNHAMIMAACPDAKYRDGKKAVEAATRACELTQWKKPDFLDTLAAAYAEAGDFPCGGPVANQGDRIADGRLDEGLLPLPGWRSIRPGGPIVRGPR